MNAPMQRQNPLSTPRLCFFRTRLENALFDARMFAPPLRFFFVGHRVSHNKLVQFDGA